MIPYLQIKLSNQFSFFQVTATSGIAYSTELLIALYPEYKHKKKKRKFGDSKPDDDSFEVNRADAGEKMIGKSDENELI